MIAILTHDLPARLWCQPIDGLAEYVLSQRANSCGALQRLRESIAQENGR